MLKLKFIIHQLFQTPNNFRYMNSSMASFVYFLAVSYFDSCHADTGLHGKKKTRIGWSFLVHFILRNIVEVFNYYRVSIDAF